MFYVTNKMVETKSLKGQARNREQIITLLFLSHFMMDKYLVSVDGDWTNQWPIL